MQDLFAGRIDYYCALAAAAVGPLESKQAKAIAILTRDRSPLFPGLASASEQGVKDFHANFWSGLFMAKGVPAPIVQKLNQAAVDTLNTPAVVEKLLKIGTDTHAARAAHAASSQGLRRERDQELGSGDPGDASSSSNTNGFCTASMARAPIGRRWSGVLRWPISVHPFLKCPAENQDHRDNRCSDQQQPPFADPAYHADACGQPDAGRGRQLWTCLPFSLRIITPAPRTPMPVRCPA